MSRLKRAGLATARPYRGVFLTEKAARWPKEARSPQARCRATSRDGGATESAEADAEGIEHYVSEATLQAFSRFLRDRT